MQFKFTPGPAGEAWGALQRSAARLSKQGGRALIDGDSDRFERFSVIRLGFLFDYSRQVLDQEVRDTLLRLVDHVDMRGAINAMFRGEPINNTERRAVLHVALRQPHGAQIGGPEIERAVLDERARMLSFADDVRSGRLLGATGRKFNTVVNIGIGGSDLGPAMALKALHPLTRDDLGVVCVSNVDGCGLADVLRHADPSTTLFIVASKTFTTQETMANAQTARAWLVDALGVDAVPAHFAAVSVNAGAMDGFGIHPNHRFMMWDWVGGRFSIWSSIGVSLAIAIGAEAFEEFLAGAHEMDCHFRDAPWVENLPVLMAILGVWNINFMELPALAVLPYDSRLARFPAFLQQLEMESNGKSVARDGSAIDWQTAPIVWGEPANNAQHSFFQQLHQGSLRTACDFLLPVRSSAGLPHHQQLAVANCIAQIEALHLGQRGDGMPSYKVHEGGRPASLLVFRALDARTLGKLIALYEHKVYAQSVVWGINAFDQWGVELGKRLCESLVPLISGQAGRAEVSPRVCKLVDAISAMGADAS